MRMIFTAVLVGVTCAAGCSRSRGVEQPYISEGGTGSVSVSDDPKSEAVEPFKLPSDVGGKLLAGVLPPARRPGVLENPTRPKPAAAPAPKLMALEPGLPSMPPPTPKLPKPAKDPRPHTVTDEPIDEGFGVPEVPAKPTFDPAPKSKEPSESVHVPPPLPYLALPPVDRVPVDDPTLEASAAAVLVAPIPERTKPLPFVRLSVPEPFEWRVPLMTPLPEELTTPQAPTPKKP